MAEVTNYIDRLVAELCPDGVEYRPLGEIVKIKNGKGYKDFLPGNIPVYGSGGVMTYVDTFAYDKPTVLIPRKGSLGNLFYLEEPFWNVDTIFYTEIDESCVIPKYLFYVLKSAELEKLNTAGGVPSLTQKVLNKVLIPVPPLEIQEAIVEILDKFTNLEARTLQYEYYRDSLFEALDCPRVPLDSFAKIKNGKTYKDFGAGNIPVYGSGGIMTYVDRFSYNKPTVLIPRKGSLGNLFYLEEPFWNVDTIFYTEIDEEQVIPKFLYYFLKTAHLEDLNTAGGVPSLTQKVLNKVLIPVPSLEEQQRIVDILDRFDALTSSLSEGLPAELAARRSQYEYYRDQLLTFPRKGEDQ